MPDWSAVGAVVFLLGLLWGAVTTYVASLKLGVVVGAVSISISLVVLALLAESGDGDRPPTADDLAEEGDP